MKATIKSKLERGPLTLTITATLPEWADLERAIESSLCGLAVDIHEEIRARLQEAEYVYSIRTKQPQK